MRKPLRPVAGGASEPRRAPSRRSSRASNGGGPGGGSSGPRRKLESARAVKHRTRGGDGPSAANVRAAPRSSAGGAARSTTSAQSPRPTSSAAPSSSTKSRCLPRRSTAVTVRPASAAANAAASFAGRTIRPGWVHTACSIRLPGTTGAKPRRETSASGSSGISGCGTLRTWPDDTPGARRASALASSQSGALVTVHLSGRQARSRRALAPCVTRVHPRQNPPAIVKTLRGEQ